MDKLLNDFKAGLIGLNEVKTRLADEMFGRLEGASLDLFREVRTGAPEVIYCASKTPEQVRGIFEKLAGRGRLVMGTRARAEHFEAVAHLEGVEFDPESAIVSLGGGGQDLGSVLVISAGTSDLPVTMEAARTAMLLGSRVRVEHDCGVAGIHRLFALKGILRESNVVVAVAGMEGALPTIVAGLTPRPVIAVPTSVGYGANLGGLAPLLTMLNTCSPGVAVVNVDNGFGAGYLAHVINAQSVRP
ncbi:MAG: nickel pincer cofactor biosynthesis protein LarB [Deltaproteobacteria bacterium]|nr:nickel pincer cofactor biosynthesis protein LarB [Deltaproteobacteria bacterium]